MNRLPAFKSPLRRRVTWSEICRRYALTVDNGEDALKLTITLATATACTLIYLVLSIRVIRERSKTRFVIAEAMPRTLFIRTRTHANFAEYVPLSLLFLALLELAPAPSGVLAVLGGLLVLARLSHAIGMSRATANLWRLLGICGTLLVLLGEAITALYLLA